MLFIPVKNDNSLAHLPIGIFDSGVGGLTVYRALHDRLPNEHFVYLGDTARVPYGIKSLGTVERYAVENSQFLASLGIKMLVVACNTASALALPKIRAEVGLDVVGVIGPGGRKAVELTRKIEKPRIGVIATQATVESNAYVEAIRRASTTAEVMQKGCPLFVPLAEEAWYDDPVTNIIAFRYLQKLKAADVDTVVLGCTHYPLLKTAIRKVFGNHVALIDSGEAIASQLQDDFEKEALLPNSLDTNKLTVSLTDASEQFENLSNELLCTVTSRFIEFETVSVI